MKAKSPMVITLLVILAFLLSRPMAVSVGATFAVAPLPLARSIGEKPGPVLNESEGAGTAQQAQNVELVGQIGGATWAVAVQGNYAYIGVGPRLVTLNVADPAHPAVVGQTGVLPEIVLGVAVSGAYAYVADGGAGLRIINVSNPTAPTEAGFYDTPGYARDVAVSGSYAYVADASAGLRIINVSNPAMPTEVGFYDTPGSARDVAVSGSYAYVADASAGLRIINVSNPAAPREVGFYDTPGYALGITVSGAYAYVADMYKGLRIINVSNPAAPTEAGFYDTPGDAWGVAVSGSYAYVADEYSGLRVINISNPSSPTEVGFYDTPGYARSAAVSGAYAYVADGNNGLRIISVSNPAAPTEAGFYDTPGYALGIAVSGAYAYVADGNNGLRIINVADPAHPGEVGFYDTPGYARSAAVSGAYAYVADGSGLRIINVSDPAHPNQAGFYDTPGTAEGVAVSGSYAYVADGYSGLQVINVSDPAHPTGVGFYDTPGYAWGMAVSGAYAYVADEYSGLRVINISDPAHPNQAGFYDTPGDAYGVAVSGAYAYVADWDAGLRIINAFNPAAPTEAGFYDTPGGALGVAVSGSYAYVADGDSGLRIINVSNPAAPTEAGFYDTPGSAIGVMVSGSYAYVADGGGGLFILWVTGGGPTLSISHIEVIQATQDANNSVPLIAGKPTLVRVYLDCGGGCLSRANVTGILDVSGPGGGASLTASPQAITAYHPQNWTEHRLDLSKTLNFVVPAHLLTGTVTITATVEGATRTEVFRFLPSKTLSIGYLPIHYEPEGCTWLWNNDPDPMRIAVAYHWARSVYPTAAIDYLPWPSIEWRSPLRGGDYCIDESPFNRFRYLRLLTNLFWQWTLGEPSRPDYVFGWLPANAISGGQAAPPIPVAIGDDDSTYNQRIFAHEVAHLLGRRHTRGSSEHACENPGNADWPYDTAGIQEPGVEFDRGVPRLHDPLTTYDYMSYCWESMWTSPYTYRGIFSDTLHLTGLALQSLSTAQIYFIASGLVYTDDAVTLDPILVITSTSVPWNLPAGTQYCLEAQDASGMPLSGHCFDLTFRDYETGEATNVDAFHLMLPYPSGVARIVLRKGAQQLAVRPVSAHAPTVTVLSPNGGEAWGATGIYTVTWTAGDADGDPLTYSLLYSPDGSRWLPLEVGITQTQWGVNTAELAGGNAARIRVLASDGVNTTADESDGPFSVGRKGPQAFILSPDRDIIVAPGTPLWLQGYAYDLEDGILPDTALRWSSSRAGDLGTEGQVLASLSPGEHIITFTATDSDGNVTTATVQVYVGHKIYLPLVLRNR